MDCVFGILSKKSSSYPKSSRFSAVIFYKVIDLHFKFRFMAHLGFIFEKSVRSVSKFIFCEH